PVKYPSMTIDDFYLLRVIGKGSYGKVMLARHKESGGIFAIKVISKRQIRDKPREIQRILSERRVLEHNYHHPFLVSLRYAFQTAEKLYFCLDYVNGGELFFHLQREQRFDETRTRFYAAEITSALDYLHSHGIVYRDLKPENCLVDAQGHIRLVDFGLAKELNESAGFKTSTFCGTPEYLSPEVLQAKAPYGTAIDWFALGTVVYEMLVGLPPFYSTDVNEMYDRILNEKVRFPSWIGRFARLFISQLLERDPNTRLGSPENGGGKAVMAHVFFTGVDWQRLLRKQYEPPFNPGVNGELDLHNIDPTFKNEPIPQSIVDD
ncbi:serum and glucocorticoid-regulated kinase 1 in complex with compound 2, partial [Ramicandelaber brevisporus]